MNCQIEIKTFRQNEWNGLIEKAEQLSVQQLWEYGEAKRQTTRCDVARHIFQQDNTIVGATQGIIRQAPFLKKGLVWISRGPLILKSNVTDRAALMAQMLTALKRYWVNERRMYLRILPSFLANERKENVFAESGYRSSNKSGWTSIRLNLDKSENELFQSLRTRWRRYFKRLTEQNITCTPSSANVDLDELLDDYKKLAEQKKFSASSVSPKFLRRLQDLLPEQKKMLIFCAKKNKQTMGRLLIARYGQSAMAYIIGRNLAGQESHINHFLYWEAIKEMKRQGYQWFDLGGAHPENTPSGILHFKQGFNGETYQLHDEIESCPNGLFYKLVRKLVSIKRS